MSKLNYPTLDDTDYMKLFKSTGMRLFNCDVVVNPFYLVDKKEVDNNISQAVECLANVNRWLYA